MLRHELHSLDAVRCLSDHSDVRKEAEKAAQQLAQDWVIVREDNACRRPLGLLRGLCLGHSSRSARGEPVPADSSATALSLWTRPAPARCSMSSTASAILWTLLTIRG